MALKDGTAPKSSPKTPERPFWNPRKTIVLDKVLWFSTNFYTTVSTMRHRTLLLLLLLLLLYRTLLLLLLLLLLFLPRLKKRTLPDRETQWPWRTEQRQNRAQKLPNVPSETLEKQWFWTRFYGFRPIFIPLFLQWDIEPSCCSCCCCCSSSRGWKNAPSRTGKHSGPEGRNSAKIEPKNSRTSLLKP